MTGSCPVISDKEEREVLEKLLAEASRMSADYDGRINKHVTEQQYQKLVYRLNRYNALRTLIVDLMMG